MRNYSVLKCTLLMASLIWGASSSTATADFAGGCMELINDVNAAADSADQQHPGHTSSESIIITSTTTTGCILSSTFLSVTELFSPEDKVAYQKLQQFRFVSITRDNLKIDMARGAGEYVNTMAYLQGCPAEIHASYAQMAQRNFNSIFPQPELSPGTILANLEMQVAIDPILSAQCIIGS